MSLPAGEPTRFKLGEHAFTRIPPVGILMYLPPGTEVIIEEILDGSPLKVKNGGFCNADYRIRVAATGENDVVSQHYALVRIPPAKPDCDQPTHWDLCVWIPPSLRLDAPRIPSKVTSL